MKEGPLGPTGAPCATCRAPDCARRRDRAVPTDTAESPSTDQTGCPHGGPFPTGSASNAKPTIAEQRQDAGDPGP